MLVSYDFVCYANPQHRHEERRESGDTSSTSCESCGKLASYLPSFQAQPEFKPFDHPHLGQESVRIESRKHYAAECEKRGLNGPYNRTSEAPKRSGRARR
jgi:hypothetical protein